MTRSVDRAVARLIATLKSGGFYKGVCRVLATHAVSMPDCFGMVRSTEIDTARVEVLLFLKSRQCTRELMREMFDVEEWELAEFLPVQEPWSTRRARAGKVWS